MNNAGKFIIIWLQFYVYYCTNAETNCSKCMHCTIGNICTPKDYDKFEKPVGKTIVNVGIRDITILKVALDRLTEFAFGFSVLGRSIEKPNLGPFLTSFQSFAEPLRHFPL